MNVIGPDGWPILKVPDTVLVLDPPPPAIAAPPLTEVLLATGPSSARSSFWPVPASAALVTTRLRVTGCGPSSCRSIRWLPPPAAATSATTGADITGCGPSSCRSIRWLPPPAAAAVRSTCSTSVRPPEPNSGTLKRLCSDTCWPRLSSSSGSTSA